MSGAAWVKINRSHTIVCDICEQPYTYLRTGSKPRVHCADCGRAKKLKIMRDWNANYRREEKIRLGIA